MCILEVLDGSSGSSLELDNGLAVIIHLGIDDDLEFHAFVEHYALERLEIDPQVVGVEDLELADLMTKNSLRLKKKKKPECQIFTGFEVLDML